jgi:hypothetical protein
LYTGRRGSWIGKTVRSIGLIGAFCAPTDATVAIKGAAPNSATIPPGKFNDFMFASFPIIEGYSGYLLEIGAVVYWTLVQ